MAKKSTEGAASPRPAAIASMVDRQRGRHDDASARDRRNSPQPGMAYRPRASETENAPVLMGTAKRHESALAMLPASKIPVSASQRIGMRPMTSFIRHALAAMRPAIPIRNFSGAGKAARS